MTMICERCGTATVKWKRPLSALTHTECSLCGGMNCQRAEHASDDNSDANPEASPLGEERFFFFHATPAPDTCKHEWGGWREFDDGRGGEQVCKLCGIGAMAYSLMVGP